MKTLFSNKKNFDKYLNVFLENRKKKLQSNTVSVIKIIKDVKKKGDFALLKYEKRYNKNQTIIPSKKKSSI